MTSVNLSRASIADNPLLPLLHSSSSDNYSTTTTNTNSSNSNSNNQQIISLPSLRKSFQNDGFIIFHDALDPSFVTALQSRLEEVLRGKYNRNSPPNKIPKLATTATKKGKKNSKNDKKNKKQRGGDTSVVSEKPVDASPTARAAEVTTTGAAEAASPPISESEAPPPPPPPPPLGRVLQTINIHKCDKDFQQLATSPEIGKMVAELAGWDMEHGWRRIKFGQNHPGAPPLVFHRNSPYFMFDLLDVLTVWIALDDMHPTLSPLEYVHGSHHWGDGQVGSSSSFFQSENKKLLYSAAKLEGIEEKDLEIVLLGGLKAGGVSIHHGRTWHGSGKNRSKDLPRRGLGLHFVPAEVRFTKDARKSKLWRNYVPDKKEKDNGDVVAICDDEDLMSVELPEEDFPLVWK